MPWFERLFNIAAGLSALWWAVMGVLDVGTSGAVPLVRICVSVLNACVGVLFLIRSPVRLTDSGRLLIVMLSFVGGAVAFKLAPAPGQWPVHAQVVFVAGTLAAVISLLFLGRSFAVLPSVRTIVINGPYRWIRHPLYMSELVMILGCCLAAMTWESYGVGVAAVLAVLLRIRVEESVLLRVPEYQGYAGQVNWRLVPGLW